MSTGLENDLLEDDTTASSVEDVPAEEVDPTEMTFSMVIGQELSTTSESWGSDKGEWFSRREVNRGDLTYEELEEFYNEQTMAGHQVFPTFEEYVDYMVKREALIQNDPFYQFKKGGEHQAGHQGNFIELMQRQQDGEELNDGELELLNAYQAHIDAGKPLITFDDEANNYFADWEGLEQEYQNFHSSPEMQALNAEFGIDPNGTWTNEDGDTFMWSGSGMVKVDKVNNNFGDTVLGPAVFAVATGVIAGPLGGSLTSALQGAGLSASLASAASSAIMNAATQLVLTGEVDITQAILSAAGTYFQNGGLGDLMGDSAVSGALGDIADTVSQQLDKFQDLISTGMPIADAAIQAGGMNLLTQMVTTGEVDVQQAMVAAAMAAGSEGINQLVESGAVTQEERDEFDEWAAEDEAFQDQMEASGIRDPFLNPNYETVGDGLVVNINTGEVYGYHSNESIGNIADLDVDGNGTLDSNDLEFVESTGEYIPVDTPANNGQFIEQGRRYYVGEDGTIYGRDDVYIGDYGQAYSRETGEPLFDTQVVDNNLMVDVDGDGAIDRVYNGRGEIIGEYDPEIKEWRNSSGEVSQEVTDYMNEVQSGSNGEAIDDPFAGPTREENANMTGPELVDSYFETNGEGGIARMSKSELATIMNRFGSVEAFEQYMYENGYAVTVVGEQVAIEADGITANDDGIWDIREGSTVDDIIIGTDDATEETVEVEFEDDNLTQPTTENPFEEETVREEEVEEEEVTDNSNPVNSEEQSELDNGEEGGGDSGNPSDEVYVEETPLSDLTTEQAQEAYEQAVASGNMQLASAIAEHIVNQGGSVPNAGAEGGLTGDDNSQTDDNGVDISDPSEEESTTDVDSGTQDNRTEWQRNMDHIIQRVQNGTATEGMLSYYDKWVAAGSPETQDGMQNGNASGPSGTTGPHANANPLQNVVGGGLLTGMQNAVSGQNAVDDSDTTGTEDGDTNGSNSNTNNNSNSESTDNGPGMNDDGTGPGTDKGPGDPDIGDGIIGDTGGPGGPPGGGGMLGGGSDYQHKWGELFAYTPFEQYMGKEITPLLDILKQSRGMLS